MHEPMTFSDLNLNKPLLNALDELGYQHPTSIQQKVFSVIMSGRDVCGIAQTGTGKTLAYLLPCLRQLTFSKTRTPAIADHRTDAGAGRASDAIRNGANQIYDPEDDGDLWGRQC